MPSAGFESAIPATKRRQTYALEHAANGIGVCVGREIILFMPLVTLMSCNKPVCVMYIHTIRLVLHSEHIYRIAARQASEQEWKYIGPLCTGLFSASGCRVH
jgi:hypothetical protein